MTDGAAASLNSTSPMRIFLTGATGYIGSAVLDSLMRAGHHVTALVRGAEATARLRARGVTPVVGDLAEPATYRGAASLCEGAIHAASESSARGPELDRLAIETFLAHAKGFFIYTSGVWVLGNSKEATEESAVNPAEHVCWRPPHERIVLDGATNGLRTLVVRPGIVYGGSRGIVADLLKDAANGLVRVIGTGDNHWALVYRSRPRRPVRAPGERAGCLRHLPRDGPRRRDRRRDRRGRHRRDDNPAGREARSDRGSSKEAEKLRRCAEPRPDRAQPPRALARLGAVAALGVGERSPSDRGIPPWEGSRLGSPKGLRYRAALLEQISLR